MGQIINITSMKLTCTEIQSDWPVSTIKHKLSRELVHAGQCDGIIMSTELMLMLFFNIS